MSVFASLGGTGAGTLADVQPKTPPSVASLQGGDIPVHHRSPRLPDFEIIRLIGRGSYGDVWLARGVTGIYRAIKIVWRDRFPEAGPYEREFKGLKSFAAISLNSRVQLALLHIGRNDEAGFFYYVMELADDVERGREIDPATYAPLTLTELREKLGRLPAADCLRFGIELARELACLHERGLVHRDIKLSNVIMVAGMPKLADIGLVAPASNTLTYVGTEGFVPPEGPGRPGADVFALGKLLYELATGLDRQEFPQLPPNLLKLPDCGTLMTLNGIILRACDPLPEKRYVDAGAMLADLTAILSGRKLLEQRQRRFRTWFIFVITIAGITAAVWWMFLRRPDAPPSAPPPPPAAPVTNAAVPTPPLKSIAVLPFTNMSDDRENEYFSDGLSEELLNVLARVSGLKVCARTSSFHFKGKDTPIPEIARQLGVNYVVEGSVRKAAGRVRITVELVKAADGFRVWGDSFDRELKDILVVQEEIAGRIAGNLKLQLVTDLAPREVADPNAYALYLQAIQAFNSHHLSEIKRAQEMMRQVATADPQFAPAHAWYAYLMAWLDGYQPPYGIDGTLRPSLAAAIASAERAVQLEPNLADAHFVLGDVYRYSWRAESAEREFRQALTLSPNYVRAQFGLSDLLLQDGKIEEALTVEQEAVDRDPFSVSAHFLRSYLLRFAGRTSEALDSANRALALKADSELSLWTKSQCLLVLGRKEEAEEIAWQMARIENDPSLRQGEPGYTAALFAQLGRPKEAETFFARIPKDEFLSQSLAAVAMGRLDEAVHLLLSASLPNDLGDDFLWDPIFDPIRNRPEFARAVKNNGLEAAYARIKAWRAATSVRSNK